jgi:hypothetical protein
VGDVQQLCRSVDQLQSKRSSWMVFCVPTKNDNWFVGRGMPAALQSKPGEAKIWEVLIR